MANKRKEKPVMAGGAAKGAKAARGSMGALTSERDALRQELTLLRTRVDAMTAVRDELQDRIDSAISNVQKLMSR